MIDAILLSMPSTVEFRRIMPLDIYLPVLDAAQLLLLYYVKFNSGQVSDALTRALKLDASRKVMNGNVTVYDYYTIAEEIKILDGVAVIERQGYIDKQSIVTEHFINLTLSETAVDEHYRNYPWVEEADSSVSSFDSQVEFFKECS